MKNCLLLLHLFFFATILSAQDGVLHCQNMKNYGQDFRIPVNPSVQATNKRSDTIDILKLTVNLNITDFVSDTIRGNTQVRYAPKMNNILKLCLDLLHMTIDSVSENSTLLTYTYTDTLLKVNLSFPHNTTDTNTLTVYYHGMPQMDPSGWGGFYFQNGYAFNLGVGFQSDPHVFGRAWFPCFDNFVERSKYEFNIETNNGNIAYCNGTLMKDTTYGSGIRMRKWVLNKDIPSYLASVSIAPYTQVNQVYNGIGGPVPIILTALPADTTAMKNSFINLNNALTGFENRYGQFRWPRVGYCLVPFSSGAMEHATNISYPKLAANGSLTYEANIMAHELSHHWWGDLATCRNEGEMWLNEGWATYSQYIFTEWVYGYASYLSGLRAVHDDMIHYAHVREGSYLVMDSIPHQYTYGDHVYQKGADLAHTLRGYLGDSLFFLGLKYHMNASQYKDVSSLDFRDNLIAATGQTAVLASYFDNWILHKGWPHFSVDSFRAVPSGPNYNVTVYVKQKLRGAPAFYTNVPIEVTFMDAAWNKQVKKFIMSGQTASFNFTISINPKLAIIDLDEKISDAVTMDTKVLKTTSTNFSAVKYGRMQVTVQNLPSGDSAWMHIEHNWAAPDPFISWGNPYRLTDHYWTVMGLFPAGFTARAVITYDGRTNSSAGGNAWMDQNLITANNLEDSVTLLYRKNAGEDWMVYPYATKTIGIPTDKYGTFTIDSLRQGQYTIALLDHTVGIKEQVAKNSLLKIYPNPANDEVNIESRAGIKKLRLLNSEGKTVIEKQLGGSETKYSLSTHNIKNGIYYIAADCTGAGTAVEKLVIVH